MTRFSSLISFSPIISIKCGAPEERPAPPRSCELRLSTARIRWFELDSVNQSTIGLASDRMPRDRAFRNPEIGYFRRRRDSWTCCQASRVVSHAPLVSGDTLSHARVRPVSHPHCSVVLSALTPGCGALTQVGSRSFVTVRLGLSVHLVLVSSPLAFRFTGSVEGDGEVMVEMCSYML